jgi:hypothetical protein
MTTVGQSRLTGTLHNQDVCKTSKTRGFCALTGESETCVMSCVVLIAKHMMWTTKPGTTAPAQSFASAQSRKSRLGVKILTRHVDDRLDEGRRGDSRIC